MSPIQARCVRSWCAVIGVASRGVTALHSHERSAALHSVRPRALVQDGAQRDAAVIRHLDTADRLPDPDPQPSPRLRAHSFTRVHGAAHPTR
jgi:hypothetical protein